MGASRDRMLSGAPVSERRIDVNGGPTTFLEGGDGPALLLIHGGIECGGAIWAPVLEALAKDHRVVAPDVPGLGESEPVALLGSAAYSDWLGSLVEELFDEPPVLVAHSLLGNYTARFAIEGGKRLARLVIVSAPGLGPYRIPFGLRRVGVRLAIRHTAANMERFQRFALLDRDRTRSRDREWFDAFTSYCLEQGRARHVKRTMNQLLKVGTKRIPDADLARITTPVDLIWGPADRMTPLDVVEATARELGWPLHTVAGTAHVPQIEDPQSFVAGLADLLRS